MIRAAAIAPPPVLVVLAFLMNLLKFLSYIQYTISTIFVNRSTHIFRKSKTIVALMPLPLETFFGDKIT